MRTNIHSSRHKPGMALCYLIVSMVVVLGVISFAVDLGHVQLVKTELRRAADSAARAGVSGIPVSLTEARYRATSLASLNKAAGSAVALDQNLDIEFGTWNTSTRSFTVLSGFAASNANAMHVTARRTVGRGTGVPLIFGGIYGRKFCDVVGESWVMLVPGINVDQNIPGTANPFLAGMPAGSVASLNNPHNSPDYAGTTSDPRQSPMAVNMPLIAGAPLTFDSISGTVRHDPNLPYFSPDGELTKIGTNTNGSENGISDLRAPINALVGVFLDDRQPSLSSAPSRLDFSTQASRDFSELRPQLKQLFFIGDGRTTSGATQQFIVPNGATRLYLATWDFFEWNNNAGDRTVKVNRPDKMITVK